MTFFNQYIKLLSESMKTENFDSEPKELYEPLLYFLSIGGKKVRSIMCLMACDLFAGDLRIAVRPALAIEYFHNFTLIHDDIIDKAPLRRNQSTIHEKYNMNTAILSGDALLIKSHQLFNELPVKLYKKSLVLFLQTAIEVCKGQQMDMNFQSQKEVSFEQYIKMITYKTGVLFAFAFKLGAILANARPMNVELLYQYGLHLGIGFQIMDDYLDIFGNHQSFGKKHAGDIYENKKTILYLLALQTGSDNDRNELNYWYSIKSKNIEKISAVEKIFKRLQIDEQTIKVVREYNQKSIEYLNQIKKKPQKKQPFLDLSNYLLYRNS